jgi:flagellar motor protein MotB
VYKNPYLLLFVGLLIVTVPAGAQIQKSRPGEQVERHLPVDQTFHEWSLDSQQADNVKRMKVCRVDDLCVMRFRDDEGPRTRVRNLVAPLRHDDDAPISESFANQVQRALGNLRDKPGLRIRFIGHTDDAPLTARDEMVYGDRVSLSKAWAYRIALAMQEKFGLPESAIESDGRGAAQPVASNATAQGRALNRRIEVEFWYADPLRELPEEPQVCPGDGEEKVTKVYDPPWGAIPALQLVNGQADIPPELAGNLRRALMDIADKKNPRLRFVGYTRNARLDRRTASVYGDDVGLSAARARRVMEAAIADPALAGVRAEHEGRGYVQSDDVVNGGFTQGEESFVRVQVVYDEPLPMDDFEGVDIARSVQELRPRSPYELNVMRITVDGKPIDDPQRSSSDLQRCTDAALDDAGIQLRLDNIESRPRLAVAAHPVDVAVGDVDGIPSGGAHFLMYTNYAAFIDRAEIRIFAAEFSLEATPLEVIAVDDRGLARWRPSTDILAGPGELQYVLRVYDAKGNFDETGAHPLWVHRATSFDGPAPEGTIPPELMAAYGENDLTRHRIPLGSGTVKATGRGVPAAYAVWLAGRKVPVDAQGNFAAEEILPDGTHTVEVAVLDEGGNGSLYLRDLEFKRRDLFYVGVADVTLSGNRAGGPAALAQDPAALRTDSSMDGRLAFYVNGKLGDRWRLTASADTREGPVKELFSNFLDKSPRSLFRRIDPDYHYPTFGDDSVVREMAPTQGKFYVKASRGENYGLWGNFKVSYLGNELAHVDRGLYGANTHYSSETTTRFGDRRFTFDGFAGAPETTPSYEEFRGTGGSVYFLRRQDILTGSERVRVETRDKVSGIVTAVGNLRFPTDYDID